MSCVLHQTLNHPWPRSLLYRQITEEPQRKKKKKMLHNCSFACNQEMDVLIFVKARKCAASPRAFWMWSPLHWRYTAHTRFLEWIPVLRERSWCVIKPNMNASSCDFSWKTRWWAAGLSCLLNPSLFLSQLSSLFFLPHLNSCSACKTTRVCTNLRCQTLVVAFTLPFAAQVDGNNEGKNPKRSEKKS